MRAGSVRGRRRPVVPRPALAGRSSARARPRGPPLQEAGEYRRGRRSVLRSYGSPAGSRPSASGGSTLTDGRRYSRPPGDKETASVPGSRLATVGRNLSSEDARECYGARLQPRCRASRCTPPLAASVTRVDRGRQDRPRAGGGRGMRAVEGPVGGSDASLPRHGVPADGSTRPYPSRQ